MEKYIFIIKCVSTINNVVKVDNVYAVTSEEEAIKDVKKMNSKNEQKPLVDCKLGYFYEKVRLFD